MENKENKDKDKDKEKDKGKESKSENKGIKSESKSNSESKKKGKGKRFKRGGSNKPANDPNWYVVSPDLTKQLGSIPFNVYNGTKYEVTRNNAKLGIMQNKPHNNGIAVPGVAVMKYLPMLNTARKSNAVEIAARAVYQYVRHANSGAKNYQSSDIMMYIMAMDSVYLAIHQIRRVLKLMNTYRLKNRYTPRALLRAMGLNPTELKNFALYVGRFNLLIKRTNSFAIPKEFNLFMRRAAMGSVVFTDEEHEATQLFVPFADKVYVYVSSLTEGGGLKAVDYLRSTISSDNKQIPNGWQPNSSKDSTRALTSWSIDKAMDNIESMLNRIAFDDDMNTISGDILKAYGENLFSLPALTWEEEQEFTYDPDFLKQFETSWGLDIQSAYLSDSDEVLEFDVPQEETSNSAQWIIQSGNIFINRCKLMTPKLFIATATKQQYSSRVASAGAYTTVVFNSVMVTTDQEPTPEKVVEWTRLVCYANTDGYIESGTELVLGWVVYAQQDLICSVNEIDDASSDSFVLVQLFQNASLEATSLSNEDKLCNDGSSFTNIIAPIVIASYESANKASRRVINKVAYDFVSACRHKIRIVSVIQTDFTTVGQNLRIDVLPGGGTYEKNSALISFENIGLMHDLAIYALLATPMMKK